MVCGERPPRCEPPTDGDAVCLLSKIKSTGRTWRLGFVSAARSTMCPLVHGTLRLGIVQPAMCVRLRTLTHIETKIA
jgi:hypothetical protein